LKEIPVLSVYDRQAITTVTSQGGAFHVAYIQGGPEKQRTKFNAFCNRE